jgi:two-component system, chemotaxis family, chemotaxis protein CheY
VTPVMKLFICDDNKQYRTLIKMVLELAGHEIVGEAGDGQEALAQAPTADPDVVLLDLNMPKMSGFEVLPRLRERLPRTKILILTTGQAPKERQRALEAGADGFIVKPARVFALDDEIQAALAA